MPPLSARAADTPAPVRIADLATRLASELRRAAELAETGELGLEGVLERGLTAEDIVRLQSLDALSQVIGEIADLLARVAAAAPAESVPLSVLDGVRLSELRRRLAGEAVEHVEEEAEIW